MHRGRRKNNTQKKKHGKTRSGTQLTGGAGRFNPPNMISQTVQTMRIRYNVSTAATDTISGTNLLNLICVAVTATGTNRIFAAVKIKEVEAWSPIRISNTTVPFDPINMGIEWFGTTNSFTNSVKHFSETMGAQSAHLLTRPPKLSSSGMWINGLGLNDTTNTIFTLNMPEGAIVDLVFNYVLMDNEAAAAANSGSGFTVGTVYYGPMDGRSSNNILASGGVRQLP